MVVSWNFKFAWRNCVYFYVKNLQSIDEYFFSKITPDTLFPSKLFLPANHVLRKINETCARKSKLPHFRKRKKFFSHGKNPGKSSPAKILSYATSPWDLSTHLEHSTKHMAAHKRTATIRATISPFPSNAKKRRKLAGNDTRECPFSPLGNKTRREPRFSNSRYSPPREYSKIARGIPDSGISVKRSELRGKCAT